MKVLALSPFTTTGPGFRRATPDDLLASVADSGAQLVVLAGYSPGITPTPEQLQAAAPQGCTVFVETAPESGGAGKTVAKAPSKRAGEPFKPYLPYLVTRDSITAIPRQIFARPPTGRRSKRCKPRSRSGHMKSPGRADTERYTGKVAGRASMPGLVQLRGWRRR